MDASVMFLDCPAYMDKTGSVRCGLPAEVQGRYLMNSTDGALESAKIRCPRGHWFNGPVESLTVEQRPDAAAEREAIARLKGAVTRRPGFLRSRATRGSRRCCRRSPHRPARAR